MKFNPVLRPESNPVMIAVWTQVSPELIKFGDRILKSEINQILYPVLNPIVDQLLNQASSLALYLAFCSQFRIPGILLSSSDGYIYLACWNAVLLSSCWLHAYLFIPGRLHSLDLEEGCRVHGGVVMVGLVHSTQDEGVEAFDAFDAASKTPCVGHGAGK